jgi:hypothetical protein
VLAVGFVVLVPIGDQILQRKAVMARHEIDRGARSASGSCELRHVLVGLSYSANPTTTGATRAQPHHNQDPQPPTNKIRRASQPCRHLSQLAAVPVPKPSQCVPIVGVPFGPGRGETTYVEAAWRAVPRLGNEFETAQDRVLSNGVHQDAVRREMTLWL